MSSSEHCAGWCFVNASRLDSNEAIFNNVHSSHTVVSSQHVQVSHHLQWVSDRCVVIQVDNLYRVSALELDAYVHCSVRRVLWIFRHAKHVWEWGRHGIFEHAALV